MGTYTYRGYVIVISPKHSAVLVFRQGTLITETATDTDAETYIDSVLSEL